MGGSELGRYCVIGILVRGTVAAEKKFYIDYGSVTVHK